MAHPAADQPECWPALPLSSWKDTYATLHTWTQIVGKVRLLQTPVVNHWWNVPLYVTARGLTTSRIPYGEKALELWFDFIRHQLVLETSDGLVKTLPLVPRSVAEFYEEFMQLLRSVGIELKIWRMPVEIPNPIAFDQDRVHASYDHASVEKFWRILLSVDTIFNHFRARFIAKSSPVHFFWGSFDLAVTRFSGRRAPERPGVDAMTREAYSHEVSSVGFWPGSASVQEAAFYADAAPVPAGFPDLTPQPRAADYHAPMGIFILPYAAVRAAPSPDDAVMAFLQGTYDAAANLAAWDRKALERPISDSASPARRETE